MHALFPARHSAQHLAHHADAIHALTLAAQLPQWRAELPGGKPPGAPMEVPPEQVPPGELPPEEVPPINDPPIPPEMPVPTRMRHDVHAG